MKMLIQIIKKKLKNLFIFFVSPAVKYELYEKIIGTCGRCGRGYTERGSNSIYSHLGNKCAKSLDEKK